MSELAFDEYGKGSQTIVLIHGFPMNRKVWSNYARKLSNEFKIYAIDLPGFGESPLRHDTFSIQDIAREVLDWFVWKNIGTSILIGHSLGGYVALAMVAQDPARFTAFGLFHSTAMADSEEKKQSRTKVMEFVDKNGAPAFTANFIPPLFADKQHPAADRVREIAMTSSARAVKGYTRAMRDRPETLNVLQNFKRSVLFIGGEKDPGIPPDTVYKQAEACLYPEVHVLADVGHMGMFEAEEKTVEIARQFAEKVFGNVK